MRRRFKIPVRTMFRVVSFLALTAVHGPAAHSAEAAMEIKVPCSNPEIVARFVAADFPQDVGVLQKAFRDGACAHSDTPIPVKPVGLIASVAAAPDAAEPVAHVWAVRVPGGKVVYTYFWTAGHQAMIDSMQRSGSTGAGVDYSTLETRERSAVPAPK